MGSPASSGSPSAGFPMSLIYDQPVVWHVLGFEFTGQQAFIFVGFLAVLCHAVLAIRYPLRAQRAVMALIYPMRMFHKRTGDEETPEEPLTQPWKLAREEPAVHEAKEIEGDRPRL